ncbi:MAG TPA: DUF2242 domain-containing protein [bacterium]|nr:DUF2242 domain-containing protein [bacterium]
MLLVLVLAGVLTGCATFTPSKEVFSKKQNFNVRIYDTPIETCWIAVKQTLLKNNFTISVEDRQLNRFQATKSFDKGSLSITVNTQFTLQQHEDNKTQIFLNATQTKKKIYTARRTVPLLIIPIPAGTEASQTQTEETIEDKKFYDTFFNQVEAEIKTLMQ